ncbi:MAG: hypothetical protein KBT00_05075 [Bacteroidales bacterium]|nr:hypothetical protein [Candidatus Cacconaster merdequi]
MNRLFAFSGRILLAVVFTFAAGSFVSVSAQTLTYDVRCGDKSFSTSFNAVNDGSGTVLTTVYGSQSTRQVIGSDLRTMEWSLKDRSSSTDVAVILENGFFLIKGTFKGKSVDKKVKSDGTPWVQNIGFVSGRLLEKGKKFRYTSVRPTDLKVFTFDAEIKGNGEGEYKDYVRVKVTPTGTFSKLWHANHYFDGRTLEYTGYHAVEKAGGPETFWLLRR